MRILFLIVSLLSVSLCAYSQHDDYGMSLNGDSSRLWFPSMNQDFATFDLYDFTDLKKDKSFGFEKKNLPAVPSFDFKNNSLQGTGYQLNTVLGGRYRSEMIKRKFFYDLDWQPGFKKYNYKYIRYPDGGFAYIPDGNEYLTNISLGITMNYKAYKDLYFGAGVIPTFSQTLADKIVGFGSTNGGNLKFSMPVVYRIGYDFDKVDVSFSRKFDFENKNRSGFMINLLAPLK